MQRKPKVSGYDQEQIQLALERGLKNVELEGGFNWASLLPFVGPLVTPIASAIGERVGSWIRPKGRGLSQTMGTGLIRTSGGVRSFTGFEYIPKRGADTPQPTIPDMGMKNVDRYTSSHLKKGGASQAAAVELIKSELEPYVHNPEQFKKKFASLVKEGIAYEKKQGSGLRQTSGGPRARGGKAKKK